MSLSCHRRFFKIWTGDFHKWRLTLKWKLCNEELTTVHLSLYCLDAVFLVTLRDMEKRRNGRTVPCKHDASRLHVLRHFNAREVSHSVGRKGYSRGVPARQTPANQWTVPVCVRGLSIDYREKGHITQTAATTTKATITTTTATMALAFSLFNFSTAKKTYVRIKG